MSPLTDQVLKHGDEYKNNRELFAAWLKRLRYVVMNQTPDKGAVVDGIKRFMTGVVFVENMENCAPRGGVVRRLGA